MKNPKRVKDARTAAGWSWLIKTAKAEGHDSLVYENAYEGRSPEDSYVIFTADAIEITNPRVNAKE